MYLYEINKLLQPSARPRQAIPYAVITYTEGGLHTSAVDAKASMKDQIAGNPRLQEIIKAINAKANPSVLAKVGTGLVSSSPNSPISGAAVNIPVNGQSGNNNGSSMSPPPGGTPNMPLFNVAPYQPGAELNGTNGHDKPNGLCHHHHHHHPGLTNPQVTQNTQLMDVLKKINARLAAEENKKIVSNAQALQGSNVVAGAGLPGIRSPFGMPGNVGLTGAAAAHTGINGTTPFMGLGGPRPNMANMNSMNSMNGMNQVSLASRTPSLGIGQGSPLSGTVLSEANGFVGGMGNGRFSSLAETMQGLPLRGASPVPAAVIPGLGPGVGIGSQSRCLDSLRQQQSVALSKQMLDYGHIQSSISSAATPGLYPSVQSMQQNHRNMYAEYAASNLTGLGIQNTSSTAGIINTYGAHPLGVSGVGVTNMTSLQHSAMLRGASTQFLKRSFPENSPALTEWDKRQKFY